jgi:hypothetical protein
MEASKKENSLKANSMDTVEKFIQMEVFISECGITAGDIVKENQLML